MHFASKYISLLLIVFINVILIQSELHYHEIEDESTVHFENVDFEEDCFDCFFFSSINKSFHFSKISNFTHNINLENNYLFINLNLRELFLNKIKSRAPPYDHTF